MAVAAAPRDRGGRDFEAARRRPSADRVEDQATGLHRRHRVVLAAQARHQGGVAFAPLREVLKDDGRQGWREGQLQAVPPGQLRQDRAQADVRPAGFPPGPEGARQVGRLGANCQAIGRAGVTGLVHGEDTLVDQGWRQAAARFAPSERNRNARALRRDLQLAVRVIEHEIKLVRVRAALLGQVQTDQARSHRA